MCGGSTHITAWRARISGASTGISTRISPTPHGASNSINVRCGQPPSGSSWSSAPKRVGTVRTLESPASEFARHTRAPNADRKLLEDCSMRECRASAVNRKRQCRTLVLAIHEGLMDTVFLYSIGAEARNSASGDERLTCYAVATGLRSRID